MKRSELYIKFVCVGVTVLLFGGIITMITLLAMYINYPVKQTEYAVGYDTYNMKFTKIYEQGRYPIAVGEQMIVIKRTLQDFNKDITCMTQDKILIDLSVGLQYQYQRDFLITKVLKEFGSAGAFESFLFDRITSSIINTCLLFGSEDYYVERSVIDRHMYLNLLTDINNKTLGANIEFFQLINIKFPSQISSAITQKQNIDQEALTAENDRSTLLTQAQTSLLETNRQANILVINANNQANITLNQARVNSQVQRVLWNNRAYAYSHVKETLGLNSTELIEYIQTDLISKSGSLFTSLNI